jgi:UDP-N-acetylmuramyl tripeptide synthase
VCAHVLQSDFVFITNNNPRLELPEDIVSQTIAGFPPHIHAYEVLNQQ